MSMSHIRNWVGTRAEGDTAAVPTKFELPRDAVKEAVVNAICHRDYNSLGSVQVMLFSDRLEVSSPGGLPKGMTVAKLHKAHRSLPVNPLLAQAMFLRGYIEKAGTGTEDMIAKCREWGVDIPVWEMEDDDGFKVVLRSCSAARCCYGYWFEGGPKTLTMINCCDEGNAHLPRFCGRGHLTAIDFNVERFNAAFIPDDPDGNAPVRATEANPGQWHGEITYTLQGNAFGIQTTPKGSSANFWESGSGRNFRTVNQDVPLKP